MNIINWASKKRADEEWEKEQKNNQTSTEAEKTITTYRKILANSSVRLTEMLQVESPVPKI